jgi:hypothetical protein
LFAVDIFFHCDSTLLFRLKEAGQKWHSSDLRSIPFTAAGNLMPTQRVQKRGIPRNVIWRRNIKITGNMSCQLPPLLPLSLNML